MLGATTGNLLRARADPMTLARRCIPGRPGSRISPLKRPTEAGLKAIPQGKSRELRTAGNPYFATHAAATPSRTPGEMDPQARLSLIRWHFRVRYGPWQVRAQGTRLRAGDYDDEHGSETRARYGLIPSGYFPALRYGDQELKNLGPVRGVAKRANLPDPVPVAALIPEDGSVFASPRRMEISCVTGIDRDAIETVRARTCEDYFGNGRCRRSCVWVTTEQTFWYGPDRAIYGLHGNPAVPVRSGRTQKA
jgi:hypothetical protein